MLNACDTELRPVALYSCWNVTVVNICMYHACNTHIQCIQCSIWCMHHALSMTTILFRLLYNTFSLSSLKLLLKGAFKDFSIKSYYMSFQSYSFQNKPASHTIFQKRMWNWYFFPIWIITASKEYCHYWLEIKKLSSMIYLLKGVEF